MGSKLIQISLFLILISTSILQAQSIRLDKRLGEEGAFSVINDIGIYKDSVLSAYVATIGQNIVDQLEDRKFDYQFFVVDETTPNAFALPGGYVFVTRGLLALIQNTSELACILGHEIIHVHYRHGVKQIKNGIIPGLLQVPGKLISVFVNDNLGALVNAPLSTGKDLIMSKYSRKHEYEADHYGVQIAALAGYDPTTLGAVLHRIISWEETLTQQEEQRSYFSDHPYTPDRINKLNEVTAQLTWNYDSLNVPYAFDYIDGLMFWDNPAKGIFNENTFFHRDLDFRVDFPIGWVTSNESTRITATDSDDGSFVHLAFDDATMTPKKLGQLYAKHIKKQRYNIKSKGQKLELNGRDAYLLGMVENAKGSDVYIYLIWIKMNGLMYKIAGVSTHDNRKQVEKVALSLRPLIKTELQAIKRYSIKIVVANNESIEAFSTRTNNLLSLDLLAKMNGLKNDANLKGGQKMKIVYQE